MRLRYLSAGDRALVRISARDDERNARVLWDGMSNSWVYLRASDHSFRRRKIEAGQALGDHVVVLRGLKEGEQVVSTGAEALYSEEFKDQLPAEDKD